MSVAGDSTFWRPKGLVCVLDTSTLVRAWISHDHQPSAARALLRLAGQAYDSFTSPAILEEVEDVLARPRFGADRGHVRLWLDAFSRVSRQVFPEIVPHRDPGVVGGDADDLPVVNTAFAASIGTEFGGILGAAREDGGWFIVSENTRHFPPGRIVYGWQFTTAHDIVRALRRRAVGV